MATKRSPPKHKAAPKKLRFRHLVCKPCWELKYCPYGPLVESFPLIDDDDPIPLAHIHKRYRGWLDTVRSGRLKSEQQIFQAIQSILYLEPHHWQQIRQFRTKELSCSVFGHICPVFFTAEPFTETKNARRTTRSVPRDIMLKVVRRDGQVCAQCRTIVADNEIEFDHIIPVARGGPTTVENLRILCRTCNRKKSDTLADLLHHGSPFERGTNAL